MKRKVGILFGGKSAEHEVSLQSAKNIIEAIDENKYDVVLIGIDKEGKWHLSKASQFLLNEENPKLIALNKSNEGIAVVPGKATNQVVALGDQQLDQLDVIFPIVHGTLGEDGSMQGMLRLANLPFVGSGVLGSAVSMDKDIAKRLLHGAGLEVARSITVSRNNRSTVQFEQVKAELGTPLFIKPANQGSSVGVSRVEHEDDFNRGLTEAFQFDHKVIIEESINGREIECSVLGNEDPEASLPGEILPQDGFYSYEAKYVDEKGAILEAPADLNDEQVKAIKEASIQAFQALNCEGLARVDFFFTDDGRIIINEINTLPGFTRISMYPKLWEVSGLPYDQLIDRLIELALERHHRDLELKHSIHDD
ncbi:D-alanine--D-alanine ligase [Thalassobacillus sp. CUG 92003]|uniref:D-alanine--D-alanine ligase n=1 Tax=Thalassobacillus sp. CUG 92003 TaxID=2736641 RepID=UPI0015E6FE3E